MPKLSLKRRHGRQHDLSQCFLFQDYSSGDTPAARVVSDDDILTATDAGAAPARTSSETEEEPILIPSLKRSSRKLSELQMEIIDSEVFCLTPKSSGNETDPNNSKRALTNTPVSSPWGHFVDTLVPDVPGDDTAEDDVFTLKRRKTEQPLLSYEESGGFVPFCPNPTKCHSQKYHPYKPSLRRRKQNRQPIGSHKQDFNQFVLTTKTIKPHHIADCNPKDDQEQLVQEAEDALMGLSF